jgi:hypothetical protein
MEAIRLSLMIDRIESFMEKNRSSLIGKMEVFG